MWHWNVPYYLKGKMTEDTSPENLRKFLESDDPAMRMMGLSMAKGGGVPEDLLQLILGLSIWDEAKIIRETAKTVFAKYGPAEAIVEAEWIESRYLEMSNFTSRDHALNLICAYNYSEISSDIRRIILRAADSDVAGVVGKDSKLLLSTDKVLNLEQEEFAQIIKEKSKTLNTMEHPCTVEELIELSGSSSQIRWIVACGIVEISRYNNATIDKLFNHNNPVKFWSKIPFYSRPITKKERDEIVKALISLPLILVVNICKMLSCLPPVMEKVMKANPQFQLNKNSRENWRMLFSINADPKLAKKVLGGMR